MNCNRYWRATDGRYDRIKNIVRLGTVQSVNASKMTARVKFKDKGGITSGDLRIIKRPVYVVPAMESGAEGQTAKQR